MTSMLTKMTKSAALTLALIAVSASGAAASCFIGGSITATPADPMAPAAWQYTLTVSWDTGSPYALSHFNVFLDESDQTCSCEDIATALVLPSPAGESTAPLVAYGAYVECNGDPSIGLNGLLLKYEPLPGQMDEPGTTGTGTFVFYSDYPPAPIDPLNLFLTDKSGQNTCSGNLTGVFPALPCDPTADEARTWGSLKAQYGR